MLFLHKKISVATFSKKKSWEATEKCWKAIKIPAINYALEKAIVGSSGYLFIIFVPVCLMYIHESSKQS